MTIPANMRYLFMTLPLILFSGYMPAQGIDFEKGKWSKLQKEAEKENKLIFVDAYTTWCGPCKWMAANVFTDDKVGDFYNTHFVNTQLDMEKGEGEEFAREYRVSSYPTLLFINSEGKVVHRRVGAVPPDVFYELGMEAIHPELRIDALKARYEDGERDPELLRQLIKKLAMDGISPRDIVEEYFSTKEGKRVSEENFYLIRMLRPGMDEEAFAQIVNNRKAYEALVGKDDVRTYLKETCVHELESALNDEDEEVFNETVEFIKQYNLPNQDEIITYGKMKFAISNRDYDAYVEYAGKYARDYAWDDWNTLNTIAWYIYEDQHYAGKDYLNLAVELTKRSISLDENYYNTDTYAALLYKLGDLDDAMEWANLAVEYARKEDMDHVETTALIKKIKAAKK